MNQRTCELVAVAAASRHVRVITAVVLVGHVKTIVIAVALPRRLDAPAVPTCELRPCVARHGSYTKTPRTQARRIEIY